jgi:hypothetical protein
MWLGCGVVRLNYPIRLVYLPQSAITYQRLFITRRLGPSRWCRNALFITTDMPPKRTASAAAEDFDSLKVRSAARSKIT